MVITDSVSATDSLQDYDRNCRWKEVPDTVMIELTNACNFKCIMCPNTYMTRKKGYMTLETFTRVLDQCKEANIKNIKLYTVGESLLHPEFMRFWKFAVSYPFEKIMISTNGSLLTDEMIKELVKSEKLQIQFSFSGWNQKSYELKYKGGSFLDSCDKIKLIQTYIKKADLPKNTLVINGIVSRKPNSINLCKAFLKKEFCLDENQLQIHHLNNWIDVTSPYINLKASQRKMIHSATNKESLSIQRYYCHIANTRMGILFNGDITACGCLDVNGELVIGSIYDSTIATVRGNEPFKRLIDEFNSGSFHHRMCVRCNTLKAIKRL